MSFLYDGPDTLLKASLTLDSTALDTLFSTPLTVVPAPGANKIVQIFRIHSVFRAAGGGLLYGNNLELQTLWGSSVIPNPPDTNGINVTGTTSGHPRIHAWDAWDKHGNYGDDAILGINQPLKITTVGDWGTIGYATAATLVAPGTGYAPGNIGSIGGDPNMTLTVDTVGGGGDILTFHLNAPTVGFGAIPAPSNGLSVADVGNGDATINVTAIQPGTLGRLRVIVLYYILDCS